MCVIIDTCTFFSVFDETSSNHAKFIPILKWLTSGDGKMIFGGTKYNKEVKKSGIQKLLVELDRIGKIVRLSDKAVDDRCKILKSLAPEDAFDDEHILAMVAISKCCVVCTNDRRAIKYLKRIDLYPKGVKRPKIYLSNKNKSLCCGKYISDICL